MKNLKETAAMLVRKLRTPVVSIAAFAFSALTAGAAVVTGVTEYSAPQNGENYTYGETIQLLVDLSGEITSVSGNIGDLKGNLTAIQGSAAGQKTATCYQATVGEASMLFSYVVQPGDYSDRLEWGGGNLPSGLTIQTTDGPLTGLTCDGSTSPLADGGAEIKIRTFFLKRISTGVQGTDLVLDNLAVGRSLGDFQIVNAGGALNGAVAFTVAANQSNYEFDEQSLDSTSLVIPQGGQRITLSSISPQGPGGPVMLYFDYYNQGRLTLTINNIIENIPQITSVEATSASYLEAGREFIIRVNFSERIKLVDGRPRLRLNIDNAAGDAYAECTSSKGTTGTSLNFKYVTRAGDYVGDLDVVSFDPNGADIQAQAGNVPLSDASFDSLPAGSAPGSLASNCDISIQTILFEDYATGVRAPTISASSREEQISTFTVTRGGKTGDAGWGSPLQFNIVFDPEFVSVAGRNTSPAFAVIRSGESTAEFTVEALKAGQTEIILRPQGGYPAEAALKLTMTIAAGEQPRILLSGTANISDEDDSNDVRYPVKVELSRPARVRTTVTVSTGDLAGLPIVDVGTEPGSTVNANGEAVFTYEVGEKEAKYLYVVAKDGHDSNVILTAVEAGGVFARAEHRILVGNTPPYFVNPVVAEDGTTPERTATAGFPTTITWAGRDPSKADSAQLVADVRIEGSTTFERTGIACTPTGNGSLQFTFPEPNSNGENVTITLRDKDGGATSATIVYKVAAPVTALINEYKRLGDGVAQNSYKGLQGMGEGDIDDTKDNTERRNITEFCDWQILYQPGLGDITFKATPKDFAVDAGSTTNFNSFFHVWVGDEGVFTSSALDPTKHLTTASATIQGAGGQNAATSITVGGVFAREYYWEDGCADIDFDELPDLWEELYWPGQLAFESLQDPYARNSNPDNDYLPADCAVGKDGALPYPLKDYRPVGSAFANVFEVRGTHYGLNMRAESTPVVGRETRIYVEEALYDSQNFSSPEDDAAAVYKTNAIPEAAFADRFPAADYPNVSGGVGGVDIIDQGTGSSTRYTRIEDKVEDVRAASYVEPMDEPRYGSYDENGNFTENDNRDFFGTDPTKEDTDGDKCPDGYEYYFWRVARFAKEELGFERYDPTKVIEGTPISNKEVEMAFHPLIPGDHTASDLDGDGLSNYEEMLLGTNPAHWDSDGDGMNDGYEVMWGLNPLNGDDAKDNPDGDYMAMSGSLRHSEVYNAFGFDPRTAWNKTYIERNRTLTRDAPNTVPFTNYEEHYLGRWSIDMGFTAEVGPMSRDWMTQPTPSGTMKPDTSAAIEDGSFQDLINSLGTVEIASHGADSDGDLVPDGWELYICMNNPFAMAWPTCEDGNWSVASAKEDFDGDGLTLVQEFHASETLAPYPFIENVNLRWWNKFWATDPINPDTDGDGLDDGFEGDDTFAYGTGSGDSGLEPPTGYEKTTLLRGHYPGGMLNPCCVDTDMDYIPDYFEWIHFGKTRNENFAGGFTDGMDGTYFDSVSGDDEVLGLGGILSMDGVVVTNGTISAETLPSMVKRDPSGKYIRDFDFDGDGLENYQEYFINAVYHFQYDKWEAGRDYGEYDAADFFTGRPLHWDWAALANDWQNGEVLPQVPFLFIPAEKRDTGFTYASTDPRNYDSDGDGMDDYYEMFHGLNPLEGTVDLVAMSMDRPPDSFDFRVCPWLAGHPSADPDEDGLSNAEEALNPNQAHPQNHHTDPSPMWMTDISYEGSFVNLYYGIGSVPMYWADIDVDQWPSHMNMGTPPTYMFDFEVNEGFDTDNDNISDKAELNSPAAGTATDPLDGDKPRGRKALYLDGNSAARTRDTAAFGPKALRTWTIEAWVRPQNAASGKRQIILERPVYWMHGDSMPSYENVRRTFRLGLDTKGSPFAEYDNDGTECLTEKAVAANGLVLENDRWYHLAATMNGLEKRLTLYIDGKPAGSKSTALIPYTGFNLGSAYVQGGETSEFYYRAPIVIGASDSNPFGSVNGLPYIYYNGTLLSGKTQPMLGDFFKGHVDEVRIWNGARSGVEIKGDYESCKRYTKEDVIKNRNHVLKTLQQMVAEGSVDNAVEGSEEEFLFVKGEGKSFDEFVYEALDAISRLKDCENINRQIPASIIAVYGFDNLPDPNYEPVAPKGYDQLNGRPRGYSGIPWWRQANDRSTVYRTYDTNPYLFVHFAENLASVLPLSVLKETGTANHQYKGVTLPYPIYELEPERAADSKFWSIENAGHDEKLKEQFKNNFPNTTNPYGFTYRTGRTISTENHPERATSTFYDPITATLYNHMLPLRGAVADMGINLWDDPAGDSLGVNLDSDKDGIPDWWEIANGLDPYNPDEDGNGVIDSMDDFDGDGLSNAAEYFAGLNPRSSDTHGNGIGDFHSSPNGGLTYGEIYTDNDHVFDKWELRWSDAFSSIYRWDETLDRDNDGWDNWSESMLGTKNEYNECDYSLWNYRPYWIDIDGKKHYGVPGWHDNYIEKGFDPVSTNKVESSIADKEDNFPMPDINAVIHYNGRIGGSQNRLVVHAYSNPDMNGYPDAVFVRNLDNENIDSFPINVLLTKYDVAHGHIRQGRNWFFAWVEKDGSSLEGLTLLERGTSGEYAAASWPTWTPGEPAAVADYQAEGIDIGWDRNEISFHLADNANGFVRYSLQQPANGSEAIAALVPQSAQQAANMKREWNVLVKTGSTTELNKTISWPRTWIHEGDFMQGKERQFALSSGFVSDKATVSTVSIDGIDGGLATNRYAKALPAPGLVAPVSYEVIHGGRVEFAFEAPQEATEFSLVLKREDGLKIFEKRYPMPLVYGNALDRTVRFLFPYSIGSVLPTGEEFGFGETYKWEVSLFNPATPSGSAVSTGLFRTGSGEEAPLASGFSTLNILPVYNTGWAYKGGKTPKMIVQAFRSASFNGPADASVTIGEAGIARIGGLKVGQRYHIMVYIDQNGNGVRDTFEPWGYYRDEAADNPFYPVSLEARTLADANVYKVFLRDPDTDNDLIPDSAEYVLYGESNPADFLSVAGLDDASLRASFQSVSGGSMSFVSLLSSIPGDADGDGVNDSMELFYGLDPMGGDTSGDGLGDGEAIKIFGSVEAASKEQSLRITSLGIDSEGKLSVSWMWDGASMGGVRTASAQGAPRQISYRIEVSDSLENPVWTPIGETMTLGGLSGKAVLDAPSMRRGTGTRFYRVVFTGVE